MESHKRSIAKALSWRFVGVCITTVTVYFFTKEATLSLGVGLADSLAKLLTYYGHERLWDRMSFGRPKETEGDQGRIRDIDGSGPGQTDVP
ncbi:MAG TPA: DUF2061 domain-containing protein [Candidatus Acetothermia bacterium]|nr:DUF2061 domain-containing protein [Candidatus Acetothermia bacterium]